MRNLKNFTEFINEEFGVIDREKEYHGDVQHFKYLDIEVVKNGLWLHLNEDGKKEADEEENLNWEHFSDYFEDIQGNSDWKYIDDLSEVGIGLTNAPGITRGWEFDLENPDTGGPQVYAFNPEDPDDEDVYWFPDYMVTDFCEKLYKDGKVFFEKGANEEKAGSEIEKEDIEGPK